MLCQNRTRALEQELTDKDTATAVREQFCHQAAGAYSCCSGLINPNSKGSRRPSYFSLKLISDKPESPEVLKSRFKTRTPKPVKAQAIGLTGLIRRYSEEGTSRLEEGFWAYHSILIVWGHHPTSTSWVLGAWLSLNPP